MTVLLCCMVLCLSGCKKTKSAETQNSISNASDTGKNTITVKKFSNEDEFKKFAYGFWVCKDNNNDPVNHYKIKVITDTIVFNCDFSYSSDETLSNCLEKVLKLDDNQGEDY